MKKILLSLATVALVGVGAVGATQAYFNNKAEVYGNTFKTGTMDLRIDGNDVGTDFNWVNDVWSNQTIEGLYPGFPANSDSEPNEQVIDIRNVGSIDGVVTFDIDRTTDYNLLSKYLKLDVYYSEHIASGKGDWTDSNKKITGMTLSEIIASDPVVLGNLVSAPGAGSTSGDTKIASVKIVWSVDPAADNDVQGLSAKIDAIFDLVQAGSPAGSN